MILLPPENYALVRLSNGNALSSLLLVVGVTLCFMLGMGDQITGRQDALSPYVGAVLLVGLLMRDWELMVGVLQKRDEVAVGHVSANKG